VTHDNNTSHIARFRDLHFLNWRRY